MSQNSNSGERRTGPGGPGVSASDSGPLGGNAATTRSQGELDRRPRLELVGHTILGAPDGGITNMAVREDLGLAALGSFALCDTNVHIADISDPSTPVLTGSVSAGSGYVNDVFWHPTEPLVFTANESGGGVGIVDVSDPETPVLVQEYEFEDGGSPHAIIAFDEQYAIASGMGRGIIVLDVSNPDAVEEVAQFQAGDAFVNDTQVRGDYAYLAHWDRGLYVLDMNDPETPEVAAAVDAQDDATETAFRDVHHVSPHPEDDRCVVSEEIGTGDRGSRHVVEFDLDGGETELCASFRPPQGNVQLPTEQQSFRWPGHYSDWGVGDQQDVLFSGDCKAGIRTFDLGDPENPALIDQYYPTEGVGEVRREAPARVVDDYPLVWGTNTKDSEYVYVSDFQTGLYIFTLQGY